MITKWNVDQVAVNCYLWYYLKEHSQSIVERVNGAIDRAGSSYQLFIITSSTNTGSSMEGNSVAVVGLCPFVFRATWLSFLKVMWWYQFIWKIWGGSTQFLRNCVPKDWHKGVLIMEIKYYGESTSLLVPVHKLLISHGNWYMKMWLYFWRLSHLQWLGTMIFCHHTQKNMFVFFR